jgi:hypothetical protein
MRFEIIYLLLFCTAQPIVSQTISNQAYQVVLEDEIYVEKFDSSIDLKLKYTANNHCYKAGKKFIYDYYYQDAHGNKYKFQSHDEPRDMEYGERQRAWHFVDIDTMNENTIDLIALTVDTNSNHTLYSYPGYNQSVITYDYLSINGSQVLTEGTGVVENEKNIWLHPPRSKMFGILEINPFPFIMTPYEIGNTWSWTLNNIGSQWGDFRWKSWEGVIESTCNYEITDKLSLDTPLGAIECYEIQSTASNALGKTYLTAYFNKDIGFVKLDYTNIDSSKLVMELLQIITE